MPPVHRAIISPTKTGARGSLFAITVDGIEIVRSSRQAVLDACRELRTRGVTGTLEVSHVGSDVVAMRVDIDRGAGLSVVESDKQGLKFAKWVPFDPVARGIAIAADPSESGTASA